MKIKITLIILTILAAGADFSYPLNTSSANYNEINHTVPFVMQAPFGNFRDPRQKDGCEEASLLMAMSWVRGGQPSKEEALRDIINLSEYQKAIHGFYQDTSIEDTAKLLQDYYGHKNFFVRTNIVPMDIKAALENNKIIIAAINTKLTGLPIYKNGPTRHTVVITGYDRATGELFINDPYYFNGEKIRISDQALSKALWNYASGKWLAHPPQTAALIEVAKN